MLVDKSRACSIRSLAAAAMLIGLAMLSIIAPLPAVFSTTAPVPSGIQVEAVNPISKFTLTEWGIPTANSSAYGMAADTAGRVWLTENATNKIARFDPSNNNFTEWNITTPKSQPHNVFTKNVTVSNVQVTQVFFTEYASNKIARFDSSTNNLTEWVLPSGSNPAGIYVDENNDVWFTESGRDVIGRLRTATNNLTEWELPGATSTPGTPLLKPWGIYVQVIQTPSYSNRFVWFTENLGNKIGRLEANSNRLTLWDLNSLGLGQYQPNDITIGTYQTLPVAIFTNANNKVSVLGNDTGGGSLYQEAVIPTNTAGPMGIAYDSPRNAAWFAENSVGNIANLNTTNIFAGQLLTPSYCTILPQTGTPSCPSPAISTSTLISSTTTKPPSRSVIQSPANQVTVVIHQGTLNGITEYGLPNATSRPTYIAVDSGGNVWFPENNVTLNRIARLSVPYVFQVSASPNTRTINPGQTATFSVMVTLLGGAPLPIQLSLATTPTGVTAVFSPQTQNPPFQSTLTITTTNSTPTGNFPLIIKATSGVQVVTSPVLLNIQTPQPIPFDFTMSISGPTTATVAQGGSASFGVVVGLASGSPQAVNLTVSGLPTGSSYSLTRLVGTPTYNSTLTIFTDVNSPGGTYTITILGRTSAGLAHTVAPVLTITELLRDFNLTAPVTDVPLVQGSRTDITLTVASVGYFSGNVTLSGSFSPPNDGVTVTFTPIVLTPQPQGGTAQTTMEITAQKNTVGTYQLTITGTSAQPSRTHQVTMTVRVSECFIATATYGSELAPQVQFLKTFRDQQIARTFAGTNFLIAFNAWYYSFSPGVAIYENSNPGVRGVAKVVLYPLIDILRLSSAAFSLLGFEPELAALASGLLAGSIIGLVYLALPAFATLWLARRKINSRTRSRVIQLFVFSFTLLLSGFTIAELLALPIVMMLVSSGLVLAAIVASSLMPGLIVVERLKRRF
jgi:streptogramin lyase